MHCKVLNLKHYSNLSIYNLYIGKISLFFFQKLIKNNIDILFQSFIKNFVKNFNIFLKMSRFCDIFIVLMYNV